jgi:signal peptidase I
VNILNVEQSFEKRHRLVKEVIETVVLTALMFVIINLAVQNYDVDGPSMEPTLHNNERIMVDKVSYKFHAPTRGDVIVFIAPPQPTLNYVKRIVGIPGDHIVINDTQVVLNGVPLKENYVAAVDQGNPNMNKHEDMIVPAGKYFVMGDDRINSFDSRGWGFLPSGNILGRAALIYWPLGQDNDGFLHNASDVFANVHQASAAPLPGAYPAVVETGEMGICLLPGMLLFGVRRTRKRRPSTHL